MFARAAKKKGVTISSFTHSYYKTRFMSCRRIKPEDIFERKKAAYRNGLKDGNVEYMKSRRLRGIVFHCSWKLSPTCPPQ